MFEDFKTAGNDSLRSAKLESRLFCTAMCSATEPTRWLTLLGPSGTGKTMLARIITRLFRQRMDCMDGLLDERQSSADRRVLRKGGLKSWASVIEDMLNGDYSGIRDLKEDWFVCLDDIGSEYAKNRELSVSKLYDILNSRSGRFTVITANLTLDEVNTKMDARIASRLLRHGNVVVDINARDYNL